jgi:coproporphyrinogen III oxidase
MLADMLQQIFVSSLESIQAPEGAAAVDKPFTPERWVREGGASGGGIRLQVVDSPVFNRASVNISAVHYEHKEKCPIDSATALSVILHPQNPYAPSMHFHISYMEPRGRTPYWRMIADLNPSIASDVDTATFAAALSTVDHMSSGLYADAREFGDKYFWIPALQKHRGACHLFVGQLEEDELPGGKEAGFELAVDLAVTTIETYCKLVDAAIKAHPDTTVTDADRQAQLAYHTLYLFQVLTLDRGTTHGLLAHDENDIGTLGSLPSAVSPDLLAEWLPNVPAPQDALLTAVIDTLGEAAGVNIGGGSDDPDDAQSLEQGKEKLEGNYTAVPITDVTRAALAQLVRTHYKTNRGAMALQADLDLPWWNSRKEHRKNNAA